MRVVPKRNRKRPSAPARSPRRQPVQKERREEIGYATGRSSLGAVLVASSELGVASIFIGRDPGRLVRRLHEVFPDARLIPGGQDAAASMAQVVDFIETPAIGFDLPLDIRGTAFQQQVWDAVRRIPAGTTATYADIARAIGAPKAMRAVGSACARNNFAIVIPCHRVTRSDGSPADGDSGGSERRRALVAREAPGGRSDRKPKRKTGTAARST